MFHQFNFIIAMLVANFYFLSPLLLGFNGLEISATQTDDITMIEILLNGIITRQGPRDRK